MKYIKTYADNASYEADGTKQYPHVGYLQDTEVVIYINEPDWSKQYLTFEAIEDGTFSYTSACTYSIDGGATWENLAANTPTPTVNAGNKIMFKGNTISGGTFSSTSYFNVMGNLYSLTHGSDFENITTVGMNENIGTFRDCKVVSAKNLSLPAQSVGGQTYRAMFSGCTSLVEAPELPATTIGNYCYMEMFRGCTSLTTAPELPATTLGEACYQSMFKGCTSLTTAPSILPATTLARQCYGGAYVQNGMFADCTSLTTAPVLPALDANYYACYGHMFDGCSSLNYIKVLATSTYSGWGDTFTEWVNGVASTGTFVKNASMTSLPTGTSGIPANWAVVDATE